MSFKSMFQGFNDVRVVPDLTLTLRGLRPFEGEVFGVVLECPPSPPQGSLVGSTTTPHLVLSFLSSLRGSQ